MADRGHPNPRRFELIRSEDVHGVSGTGMVAWGVQFPDGVVVVRWCVTEVRQTSVWERLDDVMAVHGHDGRTIVRWLDGGGEHAPLGVWQ